MKAKIHCILLLIVLFLVPEPARASRIDLELQNLSAFTLSPSVVRVRENNIEGTPLHFSDLGLDSAQVPTLNVIFHLNERNSLKLQLRDFLMKGNATLTDPADFNGATLASGQSLTTKPLWISAGLYYGHRWTPAWFGNGDVEGLFGLEYTSIEFRINNGHAPVTPTSAGKETKETFNSQELPIPTVGVTFRRKLSESSVWEASALGNWINQWNSLRKEGGTIYLSQAKLELHLNVRWADDRHFRRFHPMIGAFYYTFEQHEQSNEDDNYLKWSAAGPEVGLSYEF